jgi:GNAT superfamily N-acetyltransferase
MWIARECVQPLSGENRLTNRSPVGDDPLVLDRILQLTVADLPDCLALAQDRQWAPEEHKWRYLFEVGTVYGLRDDTGDLVGTTILTRYGSELAAVSMVLVATRYGRQGLGRRLMTHALAEAGDAVVFLNATDYGRSLYEKLGFVAVGTTSTYVGTYRAPDATASGGDPRGQAGPGGLRSARGLGGPPGQDGACGSRLATPADFAAIRRLDAEVNGVDRGPVVEGLPRFLAQLGVIERGGVVTGYAGAWQNVDNLVVGPVIADSVADAEALIADLAAGADGPVRLDLDDRYPQLHDWATQHGFTLRTSTAVMVHDGRPLPGDRRRWFIPLMQALG